MLAHLTPTHCAHCGARLSQPAADPKAVYHPVTGSLCPHAGQVFRLPTVQLEHVDGRPADHPRATRSNHPAAAAGPSTEQAPLPPNPQTPPAPTLPPPPPPTRGSEEFKPLSDSAKKTSENISKKNPLDISDNSKSDEWLQELKEARKRADTEGDTSGRAILGRGVVDSLKWTKHAYDVVLAAALRMAQEAYRSGFRQVDTDRARTEFDTVLCVQMRVLDTALDGAAERTKRRLLEEIGMSSPGSRTTTEQPSDFCMAVFAAAHDYVAEYLLNERRVNGLSSRNSAALISHNAERGRLADKYERRLRKLVADRESEWERDYAGLREMQGKYMTADQRLRTRHIEQQARTFDLDPRWFGMWRVRREDEYPVYRVPERHEYVISISGQPELARHIGDCWERVILERVEDGAR